MSKSLYLSFSEENVIVQNFPQIFRLVVHLFCTTEGSFEMNMYKRYIWDGHIFMILHLFYNDFGNIKTNHVSCNKTCGLKSLLKSIVQRSVIIFSNSNSLFMVARLCCSSRWRQCFILCGCQYNLRCTWLIFLLNLCVILPDCLSISLHKRLYEPGKTHHHRMWP